MLACILSDSLHFRSVTTTEADRSAASHLATISGIAVVCVCVCVRVRAPLLPCPCALRLCGPPQLQSYRETLRGKGALDHAVETAQHSRIFDVDIGWSRACDGW